MKRMASTVCCAIAGTLALASMAAAEDYTPIRDKGAFLSLVEGRTLHLRLFRINVAVSRDGTLTGSALGWDLSGDWEWRDGQFCRELDWSGTAIPFNCQLVEARGDDEVRFTVDGGRGESATFRLR